jgi:outer membrane protein assembly factor BamB
MDMQGHVLHSWEHSYIDAWASTPDRPELRPSAKGSGYWRRAHLFGNGDVLAVFEGLALIKVDKDSNLLWARLGGFHHDLEVMDDGRIYVLTREAHIEPRYNPDEPILEDFVAILDSEGNELSRVSILEALADSEFAPLLGRAERSGDIFHTNTVEVLDGRLAGRLPAFREGNVLLTLREIDLVAVLDMDAARIVWALSSSWDAPHQATVVGDGEIMVFDNRGNEGASRVLRFDPATKNVTWLFKGENPADFHSQECGSNHLLPNGNTLVVESDRGKAFELAPDGAVVWKYINPAQGGNELQYVATLFELERLPADFPVDWARRHPDDPTRR